MSTDNVNTRFRRFKIRNAECDHVKINGLPGINGRIVVCTWTSVHMILTSGEREREREKNTQNLISFITAFMAEFLSCSAMARHNPGTSVAWPESELVFF